MAHKLSISKYVYTAILLIGGVPTLFGQAAAVSVTPNAGTGSSQTFKFVYSDPLGYANLKTFHALFTDASLPQPCYIVYDFSVKQIKLNSDAGGWNITTIAAPQPLSSSMCAVNAPAISVSGSGNNLTLSVPITFQPGFAGAKQIWMSAANFQSKSKGMVQEGVWSVPVAVSLSVSPAAVSLGAGSSQQFSASVSTTATNKTVTWSVSPAVGSISAAGLYTAPASIASQQTVMVNATSAADPGKTATASVTLMPSINVTVSPATVTLTASASQQFSATVTGTSNTAVAWSISPQLGSISATGVYTAPASVTSSQSVTVTATSAADHTKIASAVITLAPPSQTLSTFHLTEAFGVAWPDQPLEFRYDGGKPPANSRMIGPNGSEVPFQWVTSCSDTSATKGCIVVRSNLPVNANYTWTLQSGTPPSATPMHPVQIAQAGSNWQITNGLTGVRIIAANANPSPWNLAPIQGIQLPAGSWTGAGASPNFLYTAGQSYTLTTPAIGATGYTVTVTDSGPMKVVLKATYSFNRPQYAYGSTIINTAGIGHYTIIVTLYANSKSILIDEDSDMQFSYYVPLYKELMPDLARYRGHDSLGPSGSNDPRCGYEANLPVTAASNGSPIVISATGANLANGQTVLIAGVQGNASANGFYYAKTNGFSAGQFALYQDANLTNPVAGSGGYAGGGAAKPGYRGQFVTPAADGFLDLTYTYDRPASYICSTAGYSKLLSSYPAASHATGWYTTLYNSTAGSSAPVVGMYTGRASQQLYSAIGPSMPGIYSSNRHWISGQMDAGIQVDNLLRGADGSITTNIHRNWAIWAGTQADLLPTGSHQPIADEQNSLTGINLSHIYTYQLAYPDPTGGWKWQYLSTASANQLISLVRNGTSVCGSVNCYYNLLYGSETSAPGRALLDMWKGNSSAAVQTALNTPLQVAQNIEQTLANGDNHFDGPLGYYQIGLYTSPQTALLNAILMDSNSTAAQRATAKAALALFGSLLWDNDWFPIDNTTGESLGLSNQIQQYLEYRTQSAAAASSQPFLATKVAIGLTYPTNDFNSYFSPTGAAAGSTHYQSAFFEPLILNYLNLSQDGALSMADPKWAAYAKWELSIQTPLEPRFGNIRKGYSNGDGNTEADVRTGMLGTALYPVNPTLAGNLMWAWQQSNSATAVTEDAQFVTTLAAIDPTIPPIQPSPLGSINVPGYHSAERHSFATPYETSLWFINGGFYSPGGHRHADDGQVTIYAHSAPLAIDWNANLYYPETPGRFQHNSITFDGELNHPWTTDNPSLTDVNTLLQNPTNTEFAAFANSTTSTATFKANDGTVWTRTARTMAFNPQYPIVYVYDSFSGPSAATGKTVTWNLMASGPVTTPAGSITPVTRFSTGCQTPAGALPSAGTVNPLGNGLQLFHFTGASWAKHATGGINWDLFTLPSSGSAQFTLGNWGHGCQALRESNEFQTANGAPFSEVQDILRFHDIGPFTTVILPYRKTEAPIRTVSQAACGVSIVQGGESSCFNNSAATYTNGSTSILTVYDSSSQSALGMTLAGGPQEVAVQAGQIVWTISGAESGTRSLTLPGTWTAPANVAHAGSTYSYSYSGGLQAAPVTIILHQ
jgi:hypothetical protein